MATNEIWKIQKGYIAAYTDDADIIERAKRYKLGKGWQIMAEYHDLKTRQNKRFAVQFKIPIEQRRPAERLFGVHTQKY